jgi:hypothetical protein
VYRSRESKRERGRLPEAVCPDKKKIEPVGRWDNDMQKPIKDFLAFFLFFSRKKRNKTRKNNNKFKEMRKK